MTQKKKKVPKNQRNEISTKGDKKKTNGSILTETKNFKCEWCCYVACVPSYNKSPAWRGIHGSLWLQTVSETAQQTKVDVASRWQAGGLSTDQTPRSQLVESKCTAGLRAQLRSRQQLQLTLQQRWPPWMKIHVNFGLPKTLIIKTPLLTRSLSSNTVY